MKQVTAKDIAALVQGTIKGDETRIVTGVSSLMDATPDSVSFLGNKLYTDQLDTTAASVILVKKDFDGEPRDGQTFIVCDNVDLAFSKAIMMFAPEPVEYPVGIHPSAVVDPSARIGANVHVGANAVIDADAVIGDNTKICAGCYIGHKTTVGNDCIIYQNVTVSFRCSIGNRVILQPGVVIGGDGYGFAPTPNGIIKIQQVGSVEIHDDVEIGANTTVDRARFGKTIIGPGTKIDNLVMIAHNVQIGASSLIIAQTGIAGSAKIGNGCILAAKVGVNGHVTVGDGAQVAATAAVKDSVPAGQIAIGIPAEPQREFMKRYALPKKFERLSKKVKELEEEILKLKS